MIPEIAIIGHPNEGKSSVLSTLAEDDSVRISPIPGETIECRSFPVIIDGRELLRFTDTPGFQNPRRLLAELETMTGNSQEKFSLLRKFTAASRKFRDDHELMGPIERGAGIIYVVDGSRPVRAVDRSEMEILRQIGKPRMAILNCKQDQNRFIEEWKEEFRKHFNTSRIFNAHKATYAERIELLETLRAIDQDWSPVLTDIINAIKDNWEVRTRTSATLICTQLSESLALTLSEPIHDHANTTAQEKQLLTEYQKQITTLEQRTQKKIKALYKHRIFNCPLPPYSVLSEDLFSGRSWRMLGLTPRQTAILGGISGAAIGAGIDIAALGHGLGLITALGTITGAVGAVAGGSMMKARSSILGITVAGPELQIGPARNISLLFVLLNRALLFYRHTINWAHGRRDYQNIQPSVNDPELTGFTGKWPAASLKICNGFFQAARKNDISRDKEWREFEQILYKEMMSIAEAGTKETQRSTRPSFNEQH